MGKPLIYWNLSALQESNIDEIIVATDSDEIKSIVSSFGFSKVKLYDRSKENAQDVSSTESVMLEYIDSNNLDGEDTFMLVQITSPFTQCSHFNNGLRLFKDHDSVISCCVSKRFSWKTFDSKFLGNMVCSLQRRNAIIR